MRFRKVTEKTIASANGHIAKAVARMMGKTYPDISHRVTLLFNNVVKSEYSGCSVDFPNDNGIVPRIDLNFDSMGNEDVYCRSIFILPTGYSYFIGDNFIMIKRGTLKIQLVFNFVPDTVARKGILTTLCERNFHKPLSEIVQELNEICPNVEYKGETYQAVTE